MLKQRYVAERSKLHLSVTKESSCQSINEQQKSIWILIASVPDIFKHFIRTNLYIIIPFILLRTANIYPAKRSAYLDFLVNILS